MTLLRSRPWLHLGLVVALVFGVVGLVQAISERHSVRFDLTPTRSFSISETTRKVLAMLPEPIEVTVFTGRDDYEKNKELMSLFAGAAPNFRYELLDLDRHPGRARQEGVDKYGRAVVRYADKRVVIGASREQAVAAGLLLIARGRPTRVLFLDGHGERALGDVSGAVGYGQARQALTQEGDEVGVLNLLRTAEVPEGTDLMVVAGPKNDVLEAEAEAIDRYLARGGHVLLLVDPVPLPNLERLAARHGIDVPLDIVVDRSNQIMGSDPFTVAVPSFRTHPMASSSTTPGLFFVARSASAGKRSPGADVADVALSYPDAWGIRDFQRAGNTALPPREDEDRKGPISVVAAASWKTDAGGEARLTVFGDSDFASNSYLDLLGNRNLFLNAVSWSVSAGELIAARPPSEVEALRPLSPMVLSTRTGHLIFALVVLLEPALVLGLGTTVAMR